MFPTVTLIILGACFPAEIPGRHAATIERYVNPSALDPGEPFLDPVHALGPPDGRTTALGVGARITLRFFRAIPDGPGMDLRVYEIGADGAEARVFASSDGANFEAFTTRASGLTSLYDLDEIGIERALFIRIDGIDDRGEEPGFDLDAVEALQ